MRVNSFLHPVTFDSNIESVNHTYDTDRKHTVTLGSFPAGSSFTGKLKQITIFVSSIAAGTGTAATALSFKVTKDSAGNKILTDTENGAFTLGQTTTTGSLTFVPEYPIYVSGSDTVYIWYKGNSVGDATLTVDSDSYLIWEE